MKSVYVGNASRIAGMSFPILSSALNLHIGIGIVAGIKVLDI